MLKFKFNTKSLKADLSSQIKAELKPQLELIANIALAELIEATPVDTGKARAGWSYSIQGDVIILENDVAYVKILNAGSSQQAPAYFIESIVLKYGKPSGSVVTYT